MANAVNRIIISGAAPIQRWQCDGNGRYSTFKTNPACEEKGLWKLFFRLMGNKCGSQRNHIISSTPRNHFESTLQHALKLNFSLKLKGNRFSFFFLFCSIHLFFRENWSQHFDYSKSTQANGILHVWSDNRRCVFWKQTQFSWLISPPASFWNGNGRAEDARTCDWTMCQRWNLSKQSIYAYPSQQKHTPHILVMHACI